IFVELRISVEKVSEPRLDPLSVFEYFLGDVIGVDIDTDCTHDSIFFAIHRDCCAFEFARSNVQFVIQLLLVEKLTLFEIDQQIGRSVPQMSASCIIFQYDERMCRVSQIVKQDLYASIWE